MYHLTDLPALVESLKPFYSDVRVLRADALAHIQEGERANPRAEEYCYACAHKAQLCRHCAAKAALAAGEMRTKLEYFDGDIAHLTGRCRRCPPPKSAPGSRF